MAWAEYEREGRHLVGGDAPFEELAGALDRIARAYEDAFERLPYVDELLLALERVLSACPERYVEDPAGVVGARLACARTGSRPLQRIDYRGFEAYYIDEPDPGHYGIQRRGGPCVIRIPRLEVEARRLDVEFEVLAPALAEEAAIRLIQRALLREFFSSDYADEADEIVFRNLATGRQHRMPYSDAV